MQVKIVSRKEFLTLPNGIVYSKYQTLGAIDGLYQKVETRTNDWLYQDFLACVDASSSIDFFDVMSSAEQGEHFSLDLSCHERDGMYEESDLFVIYSRDDLHKLISSLSNVLETYPL
jgi:hypothetical protein